MPITVENYRGLVWSNSSPSEEVLVRAALLRPRFHTIFRMVCEIGFSRVSREWEILESENTREVQMAAAASSRILRNIRTGLLDAQTRNRQALELS